MQIFVRALNGHSHAFDLDEDASTQVLKAAIQDCEGIPACEQRLIFAGKELRDGKTLGELDIEQGDCVSLCLGLLGGEKKKKKKKKKKDDEPAEKKTPEQLLEEIQDWTLKLQKAREERNYFQLERDKIKYFWDMTQKELAVKKSELLNKDQEMEAMEQRQQEEVTGYMQKVETIDFGHKIYTRKLEEDARVTLGKDVSHHQNREVELSELKSEQKQRLKELQFANEDTVKRLQDNHQKKYQKMDETFTKEAAELEVEYNNKLKSLRDELELRRKVELHELEERKSLHINTLIENHQHAFAEIQNYYNAITADNLSLIRNLKEEIVEMKKKDTENEKVMSRISQENKNLVEPLHHALNKVEEHRQQLKNYEKDKLSLKQGKARQQLLAAQLRQRQKEKDALERNFESVEAQRDELYKQFEEVVTSVRLSAAQRGAALEDELARVMSEFEKKEVQLHEVMATGGISPETSAEIFGDLEQTLEDRNSTIRNLEYEVLRLQKLHNDAVRTFDAKFVECGIDAADAKFDLVETSTTTGPAGLLCN